MSPELRKMVDFELSELRKLLHEVRPLLAKVSMQPPDRIEIIALGGILQSFYNGIENILKQICLERFGSLPSSSDWHAQLLNLASTEHSAAGFLPMDLRTRLREYQTFRHFFRHAYSYRIDWAKMKPLVDSVQSTLSELSALLAGIADA